LSLKQRYNCTTLANSYFVGAKDKKVIERSATSALSSSATATLSKITLFISYAWEESTEAFVVKLKSDLESEVGLKIFLDKHDILPGDNIQHELARGIEEANGIIVVYSERYPLSKWCDKELQMAERKKKPIFPVRRIKGAYQKNVDIAIGSLCWADFTDDDDNEYKKSLYLLIKGIEKK